MNKKFVKVIAKHFEDNRKISKFIDENDFDTYLDKKCGKNDWLGTPAVNLTKTGQLSKRTMTGEECFWLMCDYYGKPRGWRLKEVNKYHAEFDRLWKENKTHIRDLFLKKGYYFYNNGKGYNYFAA